MADLQARKEKRYSMAIAHLDRDEWSDSTKAFADVPVTTSSFGAPGSSSAHAMTPAVSFARGPTPGPALAQVLSPSAGHSVLLGSAAAILPAAPGSVPTGLVAAPLDRPLDTTPAPAPQEQRYGDAAPGNSDSAPPWEAALDLTAPPPRLGASRPLGSVQEQPLWDEDPAEGDDDFGDDFEAKVRQAEQRAAAPPPPLPPAYFRSRREAAAVLLRHSHFSSGAKLFGGGAIDVRVSRVFVREATREAASARLEICLFGRAVRTASVDLSGRQHGGQHGGAEAAPELSVCYEEDAALLPQMLARSPLCEFRLWSGGAHPQLLGSAGLDLAVMDHPLENITLPLLRTSAPPTAPTLGEISCSIGAPLLPSSHLQTSHGPLPSASPYAPHPGLASSSSLRLSGPASRPASAARAA